MPRRVKPKLIATIEPYGPVPPVEVTDEQAEALEALVSYLEDEEKLDALVPEDGDVEIRLRRPTEAEHWVRVD